MQSLFKFERDFEDSLRCIPIAVRLKLDTCGIKLKLSHWLNLSLTQRTALLDLPCDSSTEIQAYRLLIHQFITPIPSDLPIEPNPAWLELNSLPEILQKKLTQVEREISLSQWQHLSPLQRFALIKLSGDGHGHQNFIPALQEFGIL